MSDDNWYDEIQRKLPRGVTYQNDHRWEAEEQERRHQETLKAMKDVDSQIWWTGLIIVIAIIYMLH